MNITKPAIALSFMMSIFSTSSNAANSLNFGTNGLAAQTSVVPSAIAAAAVEDQINVLKGAYSGLMTVVQEAIEQSNNGYNIRQAAADGSLPGYRRDLMADGIFTDDVFSEAKMLVDGSIHLVTSTKLLPFLKEKQIGLFISWADADDKTIASPNGPDNPLFDAGFLCMTEIEPLAEVVGADGTVLIGTALNSQESQAVTKMLFTRCNFYTGATIQAQKGLHDDDRLTGALGQATSPFCTVFDHTTTGQTKEPGCP